MSLKKRLRGPAEGEFLFEIDETPLEETLTSFGGLPLFLRAVRSLGVPASVRRHLQLKQHRRGIEEAGYVESMLTLNALGGECLDDLEVLREGQTTPMPPSPSFSVIL